MATSKKETKVPKEKPSYPKDMRLFGEFRCPQCCRSWKSANSWVDKGQECQRCEINVMPYALRPLERGSGSRPNQKPHPQELCEKCQELGYYCRDSEGSYFGWYDDDDDDDSDDDDGWNLLTETLQGMHLSGTGHKD